jgi:prepilin-type N-terminal cleavage/methylation domain-containing protein
VARRGFTLIELLVILAVLAVLALFAAPMFARFRQDSAINLGKGNLSNILLGMHNYRDAEGVIPTNWNQLRDGGYIDGTYFVAADGSSAVKDGYRYTLRLGGCDSESGCAADESPILVDAKPLSAAISSVDLTIQDDGTVKTLVDAEKVKEQDKVLAAVKQDAAQAAIKAVAEYGGTDVAGALNSVSDEHVKDAVEIITGGDMKFDKDDLSRLAGPASEPQSALQEFSRKVQVKLEIGTAGEADDVQVEFAEDFELPADWQASLFDWNYYIALVEQIEGKGPRTALLSLGAAAAKGEERSRSSADELYAAIEKQVNALERSGIVSTAIAAKIREFLSVRRL